MLENSEPSGSIVQDSRLESIFFAKQVKNKLLRYLFIMITVMVFQGKPRKVLEFENEPQKQTKSWNFVNPLIEN